MTSSADVQWEPLLSRARSLGCAHASLFGSAARRPLSTVSDVDVHVVMPRMDGAVFVALAEAAALTIQPLAAAMGRPSHVELRHGPFKAATGLQLHLVLDDEASVAQLPCALVAHRAATGRLLAGKPLPARYTECDWRLEARVELNRWLDALAAREIIHRHWVFEPEASLVEGRCAAETSWDLSCLLRGAARSTDLFFGAALLATSRRFPPSLLSELGEEPPWETLGERWVDVRDRAVMVIQRRLKDLAQTS
jgi:hypothetical protein